MVRKTYNFFINSKNRDTHENAYDFRIELNQGNIYRTDKQKLSVNITNFSMINSMYNVNSYTRNNTFSFTKTNSDGFSNPSTITITIPYGNYDVYTFANQINSLCNGIMSVAYNIPQNSYTFTKTDVSGSRYFLNPLSCSKLLGINTTTEIGTTGNYVNMLNYTKIILRVENLQFEHFSFENIKDSDSLIDNSDILFWVDRADVSPFGVISYNNTDGGNSFHYNLYNNEIDYIQFKLYNENNEVLYDSPDYLIGLQFTIQDDENVITANNTTKILAVITELYEIFLMYLKFVGFLKK